MTPTAFALSPDAAHLLPRKLDRKKTENFEKPQLALPLFFFFFFLIGLMKCREGEEVGSSEV